MIKRRLKRTNSPSKSNKRSRALKKFLFIWIDPENIDVHVVLFEKGFDALYNHGIVKMVVCGNDKNQCNHNIKEDNGRKY